MDVVINQVGYLTNILAQVIPVEAACSSQAAREAVQSTDETFLTRPALGEDLNLGEFATETDNKKVVKTASKDRVEALTKLQHFGTEAWKEVKYSKSLQSFLAKPGFVELRLNDEMCHLNRGKDYLASTEKVLAGLTNALLEHKEILRSSLQGIVNWANHSQSEFTPNNLFSKIMDLFGPNSQNYKNMEQILQVVCGKRAECIEVRRERIISEINNKNLQATLRRVPPSVDQLFDQNCLMPLIKSLGGTGLWLNTPGYLKEKRDTNQRPKKQGTESAVPSCSQYTKSNKPNDARPTLKFRCPYSLFSKTASCFSYGGTDEKIQFQSFPRIDELYKRTHKAGGLGDDHRKEPKLPVKDVCGTEERWRISSDFRSQTIERLRKNKAFSADFARFGTGISPTHGLDDKDRHLKCILPCTHRGVTSLLPQINLQRQVVTNVGFTVWPSVSTPHIRGLNELDCGNPSCQRNSGSSLPRRFPPRPSGPRQVGGTDCGSHEPLGVPRMADKFSKMHTSAKSTARILGHHLEHSIRVDVSRKRENRKVGDINCKSSSQTKLQREADSEAPGTIKFCELRNTQRPVTLPIFTDFPQDFESNSIKRQASIVGEGKSRFGMVASNDPRIETTVSQPVHTFPHNRRIRCGLGSTTERDLDVGSMDERTEEMALELERAIRSICSDTETSPRTGELSLADSIGQPDVSRIHTKRGGNTITEYAQPHAQIAEVDRQIEHDVIGTLSPGKVQLPSRSTVTRTTDTRVAFATSGGGTDFPAVGRTRRRPVRVRKIGSSKKLCITRLQRSVSALLKCLQPGVGLPFRLDFPTAQPHPTGVGPAQQGQRKIYFNNTQVGKDILDGGCAVTSPGSANDNSEFTRQSDRSVDRPSSTSNRPVDASGLVNWRWGKLTRDWSEAERRLLSDRWRKSTMSTYYPAIKRWLQFCDNNSLDAQKPRAQDIARFLAQLYLEEDLAYSTILVHKSAVLTFCELQPKVPEQTLLRQVLKAIAMARPVKPKTPIWDAQTLLDWLARPSTRNTLFEASRRTAAILLLASGRRVHDLTLLRISEENMSWSGDELTLWPIFGSKTDSAEHRQSGWVLTPHPNPNICPVNWTKRLISISQDRRKDNKELTQRFITITGVPRPASRTVIGGWIRSVLKEAGIQASPGSVRSASAGWVENHPIDEILGRGNWKSRSTFQKFYCKEIQKQGTGSQLLFKNFRPE
ncbi:uncharacterized protein [Venturia canescens]|uniref:uncharacterized protein n=1 Tax=Venturia canescens TaxID=32260 RepID=UPI001C9C120E|nr:uncharacterized protein LOC122406082 [Venturia canescens]